MEKELVSALRMARGMIYMRKEHYICCALETLSRQGHISNRTREYLIRWIAKMLDPHSHLESWAYTTKRVVLARELGYKTWRDVRVAWIDWMIQTLKEE